MADETEIRRLAEEALRQLAPHSPEWVKLIRRYIRILRAQPRHGTGNKRRRAVEGIEMDNTFFVGASGDDIVIMRPVPNRMTREQALNLAAWIVAIAGEDEFTKVLKAVCNT